MVGPGMWISTENLLTVPWLYVYVSARTGDVYMYSSRDRLPGSVNLAGPCYLVGKETILMKINGLEDA